MEAKWNNRNIVQEAVLACVFWQKFSAEDPREKCKDLGKRSLMDSYHKFFMYEDGSIYPVLYDESCIMRRAMVSSIALLRDKEEYVFSVAMRWQLHSRRHSGVHSSPAAVSRLCVDAASLRCGRGIRRHASLLPCVAPDTVHDVVDRHRGVPFRDSFDA